MKGLSQYNAKRSFEITNEPRGKRQRTGKKLRFVVQHHLASRDHYDFRLEWQGVLLSWAVPKGVSLCPSDKRLAVRVEDHPLEYRNFEGNIPRGEYGGGSVMVWDEGYWQPKGAFDPDSKSLKITLFGKRLKGSWALVRMSDDQRNWLLIKERDEYALSKGRTSDFDTSIRTGRTMAEIAEKAQKNPFSTAPVMLAASSQHLPEGSDWVYELKYDGYRIVAFIEGGSVRLSTRGGKDYSRQFESLAADLKKWSDKRAMVLDGEMAVLTEGGRTDFQSLQSFIRFKKAEGLSYIVFDLLALDGEDLRGLPLVERKQRLRRLISTAPPSISYSRHAEKMPDNALNGLCAQGYEGIVAKRAQSKYTGSRNGDWLKIKCFMRQEFVIVGYCPSEKMPGGLGALLVGLYNDGKLEYAGKVGTGFSERTLADLVKKLEKKRRKTPCLEPPRVKGAVWTEPCYAAEVAFSEWTRDGRLRAPVFKGLREDKMASEIVREDNARRAMRTEIRLTSPDKQMYPTPITKADVAAYYSAVYPRMAKYLEKRPLSVLGCPKGISGECFFKKHPTDDLIGIEKVRAYEGKRGGKEYGFYINSLSGVLYQVQLNTLEFHVWGSRADHLEMPDMMVFDLDPDEGLDLDRVRQGATDLRSVLASLSLKGYLKTSGGKGYHIVVPFTPSVGWEAFSAFARRVAEVMQSKWQDRYTASSRKKDRKGKIFIDWMRNGRGATSVAPYSLRARQGCGVSFPLSWRELRSVSPNGIDIHEALRRLKGRDPWAGFEKTKKAQIFKNV